MTEPRHEPVRIGVVGAGAFGRLHARTLSGLAEAELVAVVDQNAGALAALPTRPAGVRTWTNLDDALRETDAEAWVVATSTASHVPVARQILTAGKAVLIEKPLAKDLATARQLADLVAPDSRNLMMGHILLFATGFRQLLAQARTRGPIAHFHAVRHRPVQVPEHYPSETPLELTMVHDLYMALVLMNGEDPTAMRGRLWPRPAGGFDLALAELEWGTRTLGLFTATFLTPPGAGADGFDRFEVFGRDWGARLTLNPQPLEVWTERAEWPWALDIVDDSEAPSGWLAEELRAFCRVVRGAARVPLGARYEDALRIQGWIERLRESAHAC